jgi:hypothetical protein
MGHRRRSCMPGGRVAHRVPAGLRGSDRAGERARFSISDPSPARRAVRSGNRPLWGRSAGSLERRYRTSSQSAICRVEHSL